MNSKEACRESEKTNKQTNKQTNKNIKKPEAGKNPPLQKYITWLVTDSLARSQ